MSKNLRFFHTGEQHIASFEALMEELAPDVPRDHTVRADLLEAALAVGGFAGEIREDTAKALASVAGDAALTLCTCSTIGPAVGDIEGATASPVLRIDRPMAERAVETASRITIAACAATTLGPTRELVEMVAAEKGRRVDITFLEIFDAWPFFEKGDLEAYADRIEEALRGLPETTEIVLLAQASMARAGARCADLPFPILSSPRLGLEAALEAYRSAAGG